MQNRDAMDCVHGQTKPVPSGCGSPDPAACLMLALSSSPPSPLRVQVAVRARPFGPSAGKRAMGSLWKLKMMGLVGGERERSTPRRAGRVGDPRG